MPQQTTILNWPTTNSDLAYPFTPFQNRDTRSLTKEAATAEGRFDLATGRFGHVHQVLHLAYSQGADPTLRGLHRCRNARTAEEPEFYPRKTLGVLPRAPHTHTLRSTPQPVPWLVLASHKYVLPTGFKLIAFSPLLKHQ